MSRYKNNQEDEEYSYEIKDKKLEEEANKIIFKAVNKATVTFKPHLEKNTNISTNNNYNNNNDTNNKYNNINNNNLTKKNSMKNNNFNKNNEIKNSNSGGSGGNLTLKDLEKLKEYKDKGIITEEEYEKSKKQILGL